MEPQELLNILLPIFNLKLLPGVKILPQDAEGSLTAVCKAIRPVPSKQILHKALSSINLGNGRTLEDFDLSVTPLKLVMGQRGFYVSVFFAFNLGGEVKSYTVGYSTQGRCLHIIPT